MDSLDSNLLLMDMHGKLLSNLCGICGGNSQRKMISFPDGCVNDALIKVR